MDNIQKIINSRRELWQMDINEFSNAIVQEIVDQIIEQQIQDPTCRIHIPISWIRNKVYKSDIIQSFVGFIAEEISYKVEQQLKDNKENVERFALDLVVHKEILHSR